MREGRRGESGGRRGAGAAREIVEMAAGREKVGLRGDEGDLDVFTVNRITRIEYLSSMMTSLENGPQ